MMVAIVAIFGLMVAFIPSSALMATIRFTRPATGRGEFGTSVLAHGGPARESISGQVTPDTYRESR